MGKHKNKLAQEIYKVIDKKTKGKIHGNPNTLKGLKSGELNPTDRTIANLLKDNGMSAILTINYEGCVNVLDFTDLCNEK